MGDGLGEKRRSVPQLLGDFLREAAVLVIVFFPLESYFKPVNAADQVPLRRVVELSAGLLAAGIMLEKIDFGRLAVKLLDYGVEILTAMRDSLKGTEQ